MTKDKDRDIELYTIHQIMLTENGRAFIYRCLKQTGMYGIIFDKDACVHAYNSGARENGLWLEAEIKEAAPVEYLTMLKENKDV